MQKIKLYSIVLIFSCLAFTQCQWLKKQPVPPDQIVLKFVRALENLNMDLAITYCDSATAIIFEQFKSVAQSMSQEMRQETVAKMQLIQQAACEINNNTARCTICCDEGGKNIPDALNLRLVEGEWRIALNPGVDDATESTPATPPVEEIPPMPPPVEKNAPSAIVNEED